MRRVSERAALLNIDGLSQKCVPTLIDDNGNRQKLQYV
jgi:hypothetical protein